MHKLKSTDWHLRAAAAVAVIVGFAYMLVGVAPASASIVPTYTLSAFAGVGGTSGPATSQEFGDIYGDAVNADGDVFVVDGSNNNTVDEVTPSGHISVFAGGGATAPTTTPISATSAALDEPYAVAVDSSGDVYIADYRHYEVDEVTAQGQLSVIAGGGGTTPQVGSTYAATSVSFDPTGVAVSANGNVYVADADDGHIYKVTPAGQLTIIAGNGLSGTTANGVATSEPINDPYGIAADADGNVYYASYTEGVVAEVTPAGELTILAGIPGQYHDHPTDGTATSSGLYEPEGLAIDGAGDLYVTDHGDGDISEITPAGQLTVIAGDGTSGTPTYGPGTSSALDHPDAIASSAAGRLYVGDTNYDTVDLLIPPLPVNTVAPTVSGPVAVGGTVTAADGSWTNDPILYAYQWQDCNNAGTDCTNIAGATSSTYTLTLNDASGTVRVVVTAENGAGSVPADSPSVSFAPVTAQTGSVSDSTGISATLTGTVGPYVLPVSYQFQYGTTTGYGQLSAEATLSASTTSSTVEATIQNLVPGTVYHYRVVVIGGGGQVTYGADQTFTAPTVAAATDSVSGSTGVAASLSGTVGAHLIPVSYQFQYGTTTRYGRLTAEQSLAVSTSSESVNAAIQGLIPGKLYHFRLMVTGGDGQVTYGADQTFKAPKVAPVRVLTHIHEYWEAHAPYK